MATTRTADILSLIPHFLLGLLSFSNVISLRTRLLSILWLSDDAISLLLFRNYNRRGLAMSLVLLSSVYSSTTASFWLLLQSQLEFFGLVYSSSTFYIPLLTQSVIFANGYLKDVELTPLVMLPILFHEYLKFRLNSTFTKGELLFASHFISSISIVSWQFSFSSVDSSNYLLHLTSAIMISTIIAIISADAILQLFFNPSLVASISGFLWALLVLFVSKASLPTAIEELLTPARLHIFSHWLQLVFLCFVLAALLPRFCQYLFPKHQLLAQHIVRKSFHLIMLGILLPVINKSDWTMLAFGFVCALTVFCFVEMMRLLFVDSNATGDAVKTARSSLFQSILMQVDSMRNEKDAGPLILSHIYLLIGCFVPVFQSINAPEHQKQLLASSGVVALAITDASAALFGSLISSHSYIWLGHTKKTLAGTLASICCTAVFLVFYFSSELHPAAHLLLAMASGLWETFCDQNDNLFLPVFVHSALCAILSVNTSI